MDRTDPDTLADVQLRRVINRFVDYRGKTPEKGESGVPLVTARNIKYGHIDFSLSQEFIPEDDYDEWMVRGLPEIGDVLVTTEAPLGEAAQVEDPYIALAQRIILLKADNRQISNEYLKYHFASASGTGELWSRATGSTAGHRHQGLAFTGDTYNCSPIGRTTTNRGIPE